MEKIRLIWDFHGSQAAGTANHHARHLAEFAEKHAIKQYGCGSTAESDSHHTAYIVVERADMITLRDALRPRRAIIES